MFMESNDNLTPQVRAAYRTGIAINVEPTRVEEVSFQGETLPVFIVPLGKLTGILPPHEAGFGIFEGTKEEFLALPDNRKNEVKNKMSLLLTSKSPLPVKVTDIQGEIAHLSRLEALKSLQAGTLRHLKADQPAELKDKILSATVIAIDNDYATCDVGGFKATLGRSEIDYTGRNPHLSLKIGDTFQVKVLDVQDALIVSRRVLLPDPWKDLVYKPGSVARAKIVRPTRNGRTYVVEFEPGVRGLARSIYPNYTPERDQAVAIKINQIDVGRRLILGRILS